MDIQIETGKKWSDVGKGGGDVRAAPATAQRSVLVPYIKEFRDSQQVGMWEGGEEGEEEE